MLGVHGATIRTRTPERKQFVNGIKLLHAVIWNNMTQQTSALALHSLAEGQLFVQ